MIHFNCPCGKSLTAREEYAGETTRCPDCGRDLTIPGAEGVQAAPVSRAPDEEGIRRSRPDRQDSDESPRPIKTSGMAIASIILGIASLAVCSVFSGIPAVILGAVSLGAIGRSRGRLTGRGLAITGIVTGALSALLLPVLGIALLLPAVQKVREAADRINTANDLKQITLAMHNYNDAMRTLPPAAICDKNGKKLLSWRVAILPYIEQEALYRQFKLDEPWDGPNNSKLIPMIPRTYALHHDPSAEPGATYFRVFVGNGAAFDWCKGAHMPGDFKDGTSNTILVVEAGASVPWTKPEELEFNPDGALPPLGGHYSGGFMAGMADAAVRMVPKSTGPQTLKAAITRSGGDALGPDW